MQESLIIIILHNLPHSFGQYVVFELDKAEEAFLFVGFEIEQIRVYTKSHQTTDQDHRPCEYNFWKWTEHPRSQPAEDVLYRSSSAN